jgi:hypothetical protein
VRQKTLKHHPVMRSRNGFHDDIALHKSIEYPYIQNIGTPRW